MHYNKNFLSKVILRLDFDPVQELASSNVKPKFSDGIESRFPIANGQPLSQLSVSITPEGTGLEQQLSGMQWSHFKKADGTLFCVLAPTHMSLEYGLGDYKHFADFKDDAAFVLEALWRSVNIPGIHRLGLRYINEISLPQGAALDWDGYIADELISAVKAPSLSGGSLQRSMHQFSARFGDDNLIFHYGIFNPDFPNAVSRREFILDIDCNRPGTIEKSEVLEAVTALNALAENTFEASIGSKMREELGGMP